MLNSSQLVVITLDDDKCVSDSTHLQDDFTFDQLTIQRVGTESGNEGGGSMEKYQITWQNNCINKKHLKNVGPIRHYEPPHAHSPGVATGTVARRLRIDVHDDNDDNDNDNAWQRGPLSPHGMGPIIPR